MNEWLKETKKDVELKIILFLIAPFFAFLYSLYRIKTKSSYCVFFLFSIFFGISFSVDSGRDIAGEGVDGQYYRENFEIYINLDAYDFYDKFLNYISFTGYSKDFYFDTIAYYISRVTENYHFLFLVVSVVFIFFALKSFKFFTTEEKFDNSIISYFLVYLFFYNQIFNINGFRFWTAAWIAIYCIFQIYRNNNKKYIFLAFLTPYFHGAYWIFLGVLIISQLFRKFKNFWILFYFISFFVSYFSISIIQRLHSYLPLTFSRFAERYTSDEVIASREWSGFGWLPELFNSLVSIYIAIIIFLFIKHSKEILQDGRTKNLYLFLIVWCSIFNFLMIVPSLGSRFILLSYPIIAYIWLVKFKDKRYNSVLIFLPLVFFWDIFKQLVSYNKVIDFGFYFSSPIYLIYKYIINFNPI
ncbi:EpsG family protein [Acinetobacter towneri]|uniref:EpsG family protein n=1 Tax=Acinetobacter towneri TaxID=202956 RepID=UPI0014444D9E|nr:EpsG family protein [Acinetobacter towneri]